MWLAMHCLTFFLELVLFVRESEGVQHDWFLAGEGEVTGIVPDNCNRTFPYLQRALVIIVRINNLTKVAIPHVAPQPGRPTSPTMLSVSPFLS
jgi:hypothetical protein